jgi:hypothetical protein
VGGEKLSPPPRPQPLEGAPSELRVPVIEIDDVPDDGVAREEKVRVGDVDREAAKSVAGVVEDLEAEPSPDDLEAVSHEHRGLDEVLRLFLGENQGDSPEAAGVAQAVARRSSREPVPSRLCRRVHLPARRLPAPVNDID